MRCVPQGEITRRAALVLTAITLLVLGGCAAQAHEQKAEFPRGERAPRIVLMPLDVELAELTTGGLPQPKAEWTEAAHGHLQAALARELAARNLELVPFAPEKGTPEEQEEAVALTKLHRAVGQSILLHHYQPGYELPSKQGKFDWSLGPSAATLARSQEADYALFVFMRDSYASAGRVAVMVVGALMGIGVAGGAQVGFASLVDLRTGDIVWFNRVARASGDLRTAEGAAETVKVLLTDAPQ